jgi:hypothetical protein
VIDDDPFAPATDAGIHRLAIPTPFAVGRVNVYLIEDEPLTLVDAGPNSGTSLDELQRGITGLGHALEDIEFLNPTHQSGAQVAAIDAAVPYSPTSPRTRAADNAPAQGVGGAPQGAGAVSRLARSDQGNGRGPGPSGTWRPDNPPQRADRRALALQRRRADKIQGSSRSARAPHTSLPRRCGATSR